MTDIIKKFFRYRFGFDIFALILFLLIMAPNFIWSFIEAPNDVLRVESITKVADIIASVFQILMIISMCFFINKASQKIGFSALIIACLINLLLYYTCWVFYYVGITHNIVIIGLTIFPCIAFLTYSVDRKNIIALLFTLVFMSCHIVFAIINFII